MAVSSVFIDCRISVVVILVSTIVKILYCTANIEFITLSATEFIDTFFNKANFGTINCTSGFVAILWLKGFCFV